MIETQYVIVERHLEDPNSFKLYGPFLTPLDADAYMSELPLYGKYSYNHYVADITRNRQKSNTQSRTQVNRQEFVDPDVKIA